MKKAWVPLLLLLLPLSCSSEAEPLESAQQVVDAMEDEGIECTDLDTTTEFAESAEYESLVKERGLCTVDDEMVVVTMFADEEDREDWVAVGKLTGEVAIGPNWVVSTRSEEVIEEVTDALDASKPEDLEEN